MDLHKILEKLNWDKYYYGEYGQQWLSNSDIFTLLNDPLSFRKPKEQTKAMLEGRYFHTAILEKHKLKNFKVVDFTSRNTKAYKELLVENNNEMMLLQKEKENLDVMVKVIKDNKEMASDIFHFDNKFEVPMINNIMGYAWKGKADIITPEKIIDIKSSSDIKKFRYSASKYNYDSQAYIYQELFQKPLEFYVIDQTTHQLGIYKPSNDFLIRGQQKVEKALEIHSRFFKNDAVEDINQYIHYEIL